MTRVGEGLLTTLLRTSFIVRVSLYLGNRPIAAINAVIKLDYDLLSRRPSYHAVTRCVNMGFLPPFGSTSKPLHPTAGHAPHTLVPPAIKVHIYSLGPASQARYVQLQSRTPDQLSPFEFGPSTVRKIFVTMTLLGTMRKHFTQHTRLHHFLQPPFTSSAPASLSVVRRPPLSAWG